MNQNLLQQSSPSNAMLDNGTLIIESKAKVIDDEKSMEL